MPDAKDHSALLEDRARKRESIGLSPHRPTAKIVVHSPPEAKRGIPARLVILVLAALATALITWRASIFSNAPFVAGAFELPPGARLVVRDDFDEPQFRLPRQANEEFELRYVGDLYQIRVKRPGGLARATLSQADLGAYRLEADLRLSSQGEFAWGYGGLLARFQNDENHYLFAIDTQGKYQIQLVENGAWRTVQPWTPTAALSDGRQTLLAVVDDGAALHFLINAEQVDTVPDPQLPAGDVGLAVGARSQGPAKGLFDWVALYEIPAAK